MNILIPHTWLLDHLETSATPEEIQKYLSLSGPSVERIYDIEGEKVYDIEITTNRVDSMSVRGVAREAAVILTQAGLPSKLKPPASAESFGRAKQDGKQLPLPTIHNDPTLCKRILCVAIADVKKTASPEWMQKRLRLVGINTHDAIIDVSNYVTHDLGHPCHTFDYDKLMATGGEIYVKEAEKGKKFAIIDGTEFTTVGGEVVFENKAGEIIDLPAIKGTKNTSISDDTKNVLFWIEDLDPKKVRFASMTHAIRTVAAQLNEKNVDPNLGKEVLEEGSKLLCELAGGKVASEMFDEFPGERKVTTIKYQLSTTEKYLGVDIETEKVIHILESLECTVEKISDKGLNITPPTFRPDLEIQADIVEEIARIYGYHNLPSTLMTGAIPTNRPFDVDFKLEHDVKIFLSALGAYEVYTYSMIDEAKAMLEGGDHIKIANPLTEEMTRLRRTLWSSHLSVLQANPTYKKAIVFEFANVYLPTGEALPNEEFYFTLTSTDDEREVKGMLEAIAKKYHLEDLRYVLEGKETFIYSEQSKIGNFSQVTTNSVQVSIIDIQWKEFLKLVKKYPLYKSESKFTPITEDLTFTVPQDQQIGRVLDSIKAADSKVSSVFLKDLYKRNATFTLTYESNKQLTADDATVIRSTIVKTVSEKHQSTLVGNIQ